MAHVETWYRCPVCDLMHGTYKAAIDCRNKHEVISEQWAVGHYKSVRIDPHCSGRGGLNWALQEADLSDFIPERQRQLEELRRYPTTQADK